MFVGEEKRLKYKTEFHFFSVKKGDEREQTHTGNILTLLKRGRYDIGAPFDGLDIR